jgi:tetratricopeptide (TPR) repeat protein
MTVSRRFVMSIRANVRYWYEYLAGLAERDLWRLDVDGQNLYQAVRYGLGLPETRPDCCQLIVAASDYVEQRGSWQEWTRILEASLRHGDALLPSVHVNLLIQIGRLYRRQRQLAAAIGKHRSASEIALALRDPILLGRVQMELSLDLLRERRYADAHSFALQAQTTFLRQNAAMRWIAASHTALGLIAQGKGEIEEASTHLRRAVANWRRTDRQADLVKSLAYLAQTEQQLKNYAAALLFYQEAADLLDDTPYELDKVLVYNAMGTLSLELGELTEAKRAFRRANSSYLRRSGHAYQRALVAHNLGVTLKREGQLEEAAHHLSYSLEIWRQMEDDVMLARTLGRLGEVEYARGEPERAVSFINQAIDQLRQFPDDADAVQLLSTFDETHRSLKG